MSATAPNQPEQHAFVAGSALVMHVINSQAGTLGKAVGETVMNSIDAGATRVDIDLTLNSISIVDDGQGLRTKEEVLHVFKVFGFDHSDHKREFGKFGLGRGQMFKFAATKWLTHGFVLDVDVRARGLEWLLHVDQPHVNGLTIEGAFYDRLTETERMEVARDVERLVKYSAVPVFVNGRQLNKDPASEKWDEESDVAYLRVTDGNYLRVYNQGIFVTDVYAGYQGVGGVLVTKRGADLTLNMARNDVDRALCPLWKQLNKQLRAIADKRLGKESKKRLTDADRDYIAGTTADPEQAREALDKPIVGLCNNKHLSVQSLVSQLVRWRSAPVGITVAPSGSRIGEAIIRDKTAIVLSPATLARFGAATVAEFVATVADRMEACNAIGQYALERMRSPDASLSGFIVYEDIADCPAYRQLNNSKIPASELTAKQRHYLYAVGAMMPMINRAMIEYGASHSSREVIIGKSDGAEAYTDGSTYIAIVDTVAHDAMGKGLGGFLRTAHLLVHELLHSDDDSGSHVHDPQFYEDFHNIVLDHADLLFAAAAEGFKRFAKASGVTAKTAAQLDRLGQSEALTAAAATQ